MQSRSSSDSAARRAARRSAWPITLTYVSISVAWIVLSDVALLGFGSHAGRPILTVSLIKGLFWVASSGLLLHVLVFRGIQRIHERIDEERETSARQVRLLLRSTDTGLFAVDLDGRCTLINRAACESLGTSEQEILGRPIQEVVYGGASNVPPETSAAVSRANEGRSTKLYDHRLRRRDGSLLPCDVTVSPIAENGTVIGRAVSFVDVSDRMRLEEQLEEAKRLSGLGRLASSIAHEINNVLMGILPFAEIVARSKESNYRNAGEQIRQSVRRGRGITQEIVRFAREEEPNRQVFEGRAWLRSIAEECREIVSTKAAWSMTIPEEDFYLDGDPSQLEQALSSLFVNARDAIESIPGQVALAVDLAEPGTRFSFGALPQSGHRWVAIRVSDNGTGMDAGTLQHLFEPFFTTKRKGTGLGLPIAYKTIAVHGGLLLVESTEGEGSTFHVLLPEAAPPEHVAEPETGRAVRLAGQVLLVEDDETVAAGLARVLEEAGMRVRIAPTGADALAELERAPPTVMILDIGLPDMDGATVCARALARWPALPVVFSTGHGEASRLSGFLEKPNVRFLMKPYTFEQLRDEIEAAMENRH